MKTPVFQYVDEGPEPHRIRRMELLKRYPELRSLYGHSYLTSAVIVAIVCAQVYFASWARVAPWYVLAPFAWIIGGMLNHWAGMGIHEAAHNLVARSETGNRVMAMIANIPIVFPAAMAFRRYHMKHHSHLGIFPDDNDLAMDFEIKWVGRSAWRKFIWLFFYLLFATLARGFAKKQSKWEMINIAFSCVVACGLWFLVGPWGLAYLGMSTFLGYGMHPASAHFLHEHYIWSPGQETYSYYGPLNWVNFNVGYHIEHHDLMWIPGWKLPLIRARAPEFYDGFVSHKSWTHVLYKFVVDPRYGHDSRITRSRDTLKPGRLFLDTYGLRRKSLTTEERSIERETGALA